jgi:phosphoribosyl 1,2-cyclic phosphodiesterase
MNENFTIKFWGVRGSHPAPGAQTVYYGGNTACVEVCAAGQTIILDAGTGIIPLGRELVRHYAVYGASERERMEINLRVPSTILFSHLHHDHTQGFPFFGPAYHPAARLNLYGPGTSEQALEQILAQNQTPPAFPVTLRDMSATKEIHSLKETDVISFEEGFPKLGKPTCPDSLSIRLMCSFAHPGHVYVYRIEWRGLSLVYATDTEGYVSGDQRLAAFARGADLLIHDAQYTQADYVMKQGFGHSTPQMAADLARAAGVKRLALFHYDPSYDDETIHDMEEQAQACFKTTFAAREGLVVELSAATTNLFSGDRRQPEVAELQTAQNKAS